jgi:23S rRNA (guanosine2251-2'-O)-methyltransferase
VIFVIFVVPIQEISGNMERLYGRHAVHECLRARRRKMLRLLIAEGVQDALILREMQQLAHEQRVQLGTAKREFFDQVSPHAQGVLLEVEEYPYAEWEDLLITMPRGVGSGDAAEPPLILILDSLQDPQNFGNLIRTAEAVGVSGIVIAERRSASVTPAVVNASAGATEHLRIARVVNLARTVDLLKKQDVWVAALQDIYAANLKGAMALIVGSEGEGVSRLLRDKADFVIKLPMRGKIESLNASVAGAVALYEIVRQRNV